VSRVEGIERLFDEAEGNFGRPDVLVNDAGE
jgi:NAD(P)-dependent dehydrogenase (short-subunit alcohol dehydrogenase family)